MKTLIIAVAALVTSVSAFADQTQLPLKVRRGDFTSYTLGAIQYVDRVILLTRGNATLEISTNGISKGLIKLPGHRASHVVTIADRASSIEFRNIGDGSASIKKIQVLQTARFPGYPGYPVVVPGDLGAIGNVLMNLNSLNDVLSDFADAAQQAQYVVQIRAAVNTALVLVQTRSAFSEELKASLANVIQKIDTAEPWLSSVRQIEAIAHIAQEIDVAKGLLQQMISHQ